MFFCNLHRFRNQEQYSEKCLQSSSVSFTSERFVVIVRSFVRLYRGLCFLVCVVALFFCVGCDEKKGERCVKIPNLYI